MTACSPEPTPVSTPSAAPARSVTPRPGGATPTLPVARPVAPTASPGAGGSPVAGRESGQSSGQPFVLRSPAFAAGADLPAEFTCDGKGNSPPLSWSGAPAGTRAFALIAEDGDATAGDTSFVHWLVYNMPARTTQLPAAVEPKPVLSNGAQQGLNSDQTIGYFNPCPNRGDPPHHFNFDLFAQDGYVTLETGASVDTVRDALKGHILGQAELVATYQR